MRPLSCEDMVLVSVTPNPSFRFRRGLEASSWGGVFPVSEDQVQVQPFVLVPVVALTLDLRVITAFSSPEVAQPL